MPHGGSYHHPSGNTPEIPSFFFFFFLKNFDSQNYFTTRRCTYEERSARVMIVFDFSNLFLVSGTDSFIGRSVITRDCLRLINIEDQSRSQVQSREELLVILDELLQFNLESRRLSSGGRFLGGTPLDQGGLSAKEFHIPASSLPDRAHVEKIPRQSDDLCY